MKKRTNIFVFSLALLGLLIGCSNGQTSTSTSDSTPSSIVPSISLESESTSVENESTSEVISEESTTFPSETHTSEESSSVPLTPEEALLKEIDEGKFEVKINIHQTKKVFDIHTDKQKEMILDPSFKLPSGIGGVKENSRPKPINLNFDTNLKAYDFIKSYTISLSKDPSFEEAWEYETTSTNLDVFNLEIGTHYYWNVSTNILDRKFTSSTLEFDTLNEGPRNIYISGVTNVRDLGGYASSLGGKVKQGLVYRTGRLNRNNVDVPENHIHEKGIIQMKKYLKMKSEIDLRENDNNEIGGITSSPLGEGVNYYNVPMNFTFRNESNLVRNQEKIKECFDIFSEQSNYPLFFHCSIGTDRTGMVAYLLNGLLGVDQDTLFKDYLFSNFGNISGSRDLNHIKRNYVKEIDEYRGDSLPSKVENYLLDIGITQAQIDNIRNIMLEK